MLLLLIYSALLLFLLIGLFLLLSLAVALYTVHNIHRPFPRRVEDSYFITPFELQIPYRNVKFLASDGVELAGWFLPRKNSRRLVLLLCGRDGRKHRLIGISGGLWRAGFSVFLFDYRGRGESERSRVSVGHYEGRDARAALRKARHLARQVAPKGAPLSIGLLGYSMGGSLALQLAAEKQDLQAVAADCPFSSLPAIIKERQRRNHFYPYWIALWLTTLIIRWRFGYSIDHIDALSAVGKIAPRPLMLIHAMKDQAVSAAHSRRLYEAAAEPRYLLLEEGAGHCGSYFRDRQRYIDTMVDFFRSSMKKKRRSA